MIVIGSEAALNCSHHSGNHPKGEHFAYSGMHEMGAVGINPFVEPEKLAEFTHRVKILLRDIALPKRESIEVIYPVCFC